MTEKRATNEERRQLKQRIVAAITEMELPAVDVGQVLVSIGAAMLKASDNSETEFLDYARKAWALQSAQGSPQHD